MAQGACPTKDIKTRPSGFSLSVSPALYLAVVVFVTAAGVAWLLHKGPVPVIRITTALEEKAPFLYMLTPFPFLGMLTAEFLALFSAHRLARSSVDLAVVIAALVLISHLRLSLRLPLSGHAMLFTYFIFRRAFLERVVLPWRRAELWIAVAISTALIYLKLVWWTDPVTLLAGVLLGGVLYLGSRYIFAPAEVPGDGAVPGRQG